MGSRVRHLLGEAVLLVVVLAGLMIVPLVVGWLVVALSYGSSHTAVVDAGQRLRVTAAPGERVIVGVRIPGVIDGLWASTTGLRLTAPGRDDIEIVPPTRRSWNDSVPWDVAEPYGAAVVGAVFVMPSGKTFEGTLEGEVTVPRGGFFFHNETVRVSTPMALTPTSWSWNGWPVYVWLHRSVVLAAGVLAVSATVCLVRKARRHDPGARPLGQVLPVAGTGLVAAVTVGLGAGFGVRWAAPDEAGMLLAPPEPLVTAPLLLAAAVLAFMLNAALTPGVD